MRILAYRFAWPELSWDRGDERWDAEDDRDPMEKFDLALEYGQPSPDDRHVSEKKSHPSVSERDASESRTGVEATEVTANATATERGTDGYVVLEDVEAITNAEGEDDDEENDK
jgi:hypothetical protein